MQKSAATRYWKMGGFFALLILGYIAYTFSPLARPEVGTPIDELDGVKVYYNGPRKHLSAADEEDARKWECSEFVCRYYCVNYDMMVPDSMALAVDFFDSEMEDGDINPALGLQQFANGSSIPPQKGDIVVLNGHLFDSSGHLGVVSVVSDRSVEIVQQNVGTSTRRIFRLLHEDGSWKISSRRVLGWLRKPAES